MSALSSIDILWNGFTPAFRDLLNDWNPGDLDSEQQYQDSLFDFLRARLPECIVQREYNEAGSRVDIYLKRKGFRGDQEAFFEVKHNLFGKSEGDRLVGQLDAMDPERRKIVVVLCVLGSLDDQTMLGRLEELSKQSDDKNTKYFANQVLLVHTQTHVYADVM